MELGFKPDWALPPHAEAFMSVRSGGVSKAPMDTLNLGDHVGDDPEAVRLNRGRLCAHLGIATAFLHQTHGEGVQYLSAASVGGPRLSGDIAVTTTRGIAATIMVADCLPILFVHQRLPLVAAAHAGWRGLAGTGTAGGKDGIGVIAQTLRVMADAADQTPAELADALTVWLGPAIGPMAFEVGEDVRGAFLSKNPANADAFVPQATPGKYLADLPLIARRMLAGYGVAAVYGNDSTERWCTVGQPNRYFSHRRDQHKGGSGRLAAMVWLK